MTAQPDWRPIDTAPREEFVEVLLLRASDGFWTAGFWREGDTLVFGDGDETWWPSAWYDLDYQEIDPPPTHWAPLAGEAVELPPGGKEGE